VGSGFDRSIYWILTVITIDIHFTITTHKPETFLLLWYYFTSYLSCLPASLLSVSVLTVCRLSPLNYVSSAFCFGPILSGALLALLVLNCSLFSNSGLLLSVSVCYNRQPDGLEDTLSNPSVSCFPMQQWLVYSFPRKPTSLNSVTAEVCVRIVDIA
jgi:hypothetical protein